VDATPAESKPANCKSPRKQAADEVADAATTEPVKETAKPAKGKKKSKAATNGDAPEPAAEVVVEVKAQAPKKKAKAAKDGAAPEPAAEVVVEVKTQAKPKKQARKGKTVVVADNIVVEAPKATTEKAKKGKKGKSAETVPAPVEEDVMAGAEDEAPPTKSKKAKGKGSKKQAEPVEEVADVEVASEAEGEGDEDDQTAALLAGFESDEDEQDPDEDDKFANDAKVPTLSKKQKTALEKAATGPKANQPGVIYVGYDTLTTLLRLYANFLPVAFLAASSSLK
jgi:nucleolar protein 15